MKNRLNKLMSILLVLLLAGCIARCPVFAAYDETTGSISITKYEDSEAKKPIEGVTFALYQMTAYSDNVYTVKPGFDGIFAGMEKNGQIDPNDYDLSKIQNRTDAIVQAIDSGGIASYASVTTDADGKAVFSDLPEGCWFVEETAAPDYVKEKSANFIVSVPMTNESGDGLIYDISVYPKNIVVYTTPETEPAPSTPVYTGITTQMSVSILIGTAALAAGIALYMAKRKKCRQN